MNSESLILTVRRRNRRGRASDQQKLKNVRIGTASRWPRQARGDIQPRQSAIHTSALPLTSEQHPPGDLAIERLRGVLAIGAKPAILAAPTIGTSVA